MRILLDTEFPSSTEYEAPSEVELIRHSGQQIEDEDLVARAVGSRTDAIAVLSRKSIHQPILRKKCSEHAIKLIVVDTTDPFEAKTRLLHNINKIQSELSNSDVSIVLVLRSKVLRINETDLG